MSAPAQWPHEAARLNEIVYGNIVTPEPLFQGFMLDQTVTFLSGQPYVGKSMILAHMALCLDTAMPLFGRFPPLGIKKPLCILQDAPTYDYAEQFRKLVRGAGLDKHHVELLETRLILNENIRIDDPGFMPWLADLHDRDQFDVVLLDAMWMLHSLDENNGSHAAFLTRTLKHIRDRLGVAVVVAHHQRKVTIADAMGGGKNEKIRGHSNFAAGIDFHIMLSRQGDTIRCELPKARGMKETLAEVKIEEVDHPDGEALRIVSLAAESSRLERLVAFLGEPKKRAEVEEFYRAAHKMTTAQARRAADMDLRTLHAYGRIRRAAYGVWECSLSPR